MNGVLINRSELTRAERDEMFALLECHFRGVHRQTFERDLDDKNWVLLLIEASRLKGFSTLRAYDTTCDGERVSVIYSGDTIVDRDVWHSAALPRTWIAAVRSLRERFLRGPRLYWLLLTSGIRTYRLLPVFWRDFHPRHDAPTSAEAERLLATLATERFGACYRADSGIVTFPAPQVLREHLCDISPGRLLDPHVAYFLRRNPRWRQGDELVCLTEIAFENLTAAGRRTWNSTASSGFMERAG
jgi:hypothetical protein